MVTKEVTCTKKKTDVNCKIEMNEVTYLGIKFL